MPVTTTDIPKLINPTWRGRERQHAVRLWFEALASVLLAAIVAFVYAPAGAAVLMLGLGLVIRRSVQRQLVLASVIDRYDHPESQTPMERLDWLRFRAERRIPILQDLDANERDELALLEQALEIGWIGHGHGVRTIAEAERHREVTGQAA
jgi:hypothetical protein